MLIEAGIDVIGEKSLMATLEDAVALEKQVCESGRFVGVDVYVFWLPDGE